jgi:hypothetical protein
MPLSVCQALYMVPGSVKTTKASQQSRRRTPTCATAWHQYAAPLRTRRRGPAGSAEASLPVSLRMLHLGNLKKCLRRVRELRTLADEWREALADDRSTRGKSCRNCSSVA